MGAVFLRHWKVMGVPPVTVTLNVAVWPRLTVRLAGGTVTTGGLAMVRVANWPLVDPQGFRTIARHWVLLSEATSGGVV